MRKVHQLSYFNFDDIDEIYIKYKDVTGSRKRFMFARNLDNRLMYILFLMDQLSLDYQNDYNMVKLDVKVKNLKAGDKTCDILGFHYDWVKDFNHANKHEKHLIYTNKFGTMFENEQCDDNCIYEYGRELHSGLIVPEDCKRVLIRMSFVDRLK